MAQRLLEGDVIDNDGDDQEIDRLRNELARATRERDALRADNVRLRQRVNQVDGPVAQLRQTLEPLYRSLQALWGDIEVIDPQHPASGPAQAPTSAPNPQEARSSPAWESWKQRMPGAPAKLIEAMQLHKEVTVEQLVVLTQITRKQTIYDAIARMNKSGLINKNGGKFSLKQI